jgi:hypothetical protein
VYLHVYIGLSSQCQAGKDNLEEEQDHHGGKELGIRRKITFRRYEFEETRILAISSIKTQARDQDNRQSSYEGHGWHAKGHQIAHLLSHAQTVDTEGGDGDTGQLHQSHEARSFSSDGTNVTKLININIYLLVSAMATERGRAAEKAKLSPGAQGPTQIAFKMAQLKFITRSLISRYAFQSTNR